MRKLAAALSIALTVSTVGISSGILSAETTAVVAAEVTVEGKQLQAFEELKAMFTESVVLVDVKAKYATTVQADVQAANPEIDEKISAVIDLGIEGHLSAGQVKQAVDKGLQWFFYTVITNYTKTDAKGALVNGDTEAAKAALDKAIELYKGSLDPTAGKRDSGFAKFDVKTQDLLNTIIIPGLQKAVEDKDVLSFDLYRQMFDKTLIKVFHLAALGYAEKIPTLTDEAAAKINVTEGYFFYMPIVNSLKGGNQEAAELIEKAFESGDPAQIDPVQIKAAFAAALNGKVSGYVNKTIASMEKGDLHAAQVTAMEGNMFVAAEEVLIKERLGDEAFVSVAASAQNYFAAVAAGNIADAKLHSFDVLKVVSQLDGVQLKVSSNTLTVNGDEKTVDAQAYINAKTNRTLVPTRAIAEALGAEVDYVAETKTVVIKKNRSVTELVVGSSAVVQDGKVNEDLTLDQAVEIKNGRAFIPLRAVAELFGNKVFYSKQEIVIVK
ncbi:copper amine oxidase N-terminal domain-containing protein [Paenibacillus tarimensis]